MSSSAESRAVKQLKLDSGKARKERRRSSLTRGRRSSIGIPGLRNNDTEIKSLKEPEDFDKLLSNCFETALKNSTEYLNSQSDTNQITSQMRQMFKEVLADMKSENEWPKIQTPEQSTTVDRTKQEIERCETYTYKLEKQCKDWDSFAAKFANEEFLRSDINSEVAVENTETQCTPNCKQLLQNLNYMKENLLIKVDRISAEVNSQAKTTFDVQNATKSSELHRNNFSADKISSPNIKQLIRELPLDTTP